MKTSTEAFLERLEELERRAIPGKYRTSESGTHFYVRTEDELVLEVPYDEHTLDRLKNAQYAAAGPSALFYEANKALYTIDDILKEKP